MTVRRAIGAGVAAAAFAVLLVRGADHGDAPGVRINSRLDINDVYAFQAPGNAGHTVLIMTVSPLAGITGATTFHPQGKSPPQGRHQRRRRRGHHLPDHLLQPRRQGRAARPPEGDRPNDDDDDDGERQRQRRRGDRPHRGEHFRWRRRYAARGAVRRSVLLRPARVSGTGSRSALAASARTSSAGWTRSRSSSSCRARTSEPARSASGGSRRREARRSIGWDVRRSTPSSSRAT